MSPLKNDVELLQGGPTRCSTFVRSQLRVCRARYKLQLRILLCEIENNLAEHTTIQNCYKVLFNQKKAPTPSKINGCTREEQPAMWRTHYKGVFKAEDTAYNGGIFDIIDEKLVSEKGNMQLYSFTMEEMSTAISEINPSKSYKRHHH